MSMSIVAKPQLETNRNAVVRYLNRLVSKKDWGYKYKTKPIHANCKDDIVALNQGKLTDRYGGRKQFLSTLTRKVYSSHWRGDTTAYFTAGEGDQLLLMVDIDCHEKGTIAEATQCASFLRDQLFPGMYVEPSTNGNGMHGYLIVNRAKRLPEDVVAFYKQMQAYVRQYEHLHGVEMIEVKGHPAHCDRDENGYAINLHMGQLAKVPRQIADRFDEFQATAQVTIGQFDFTRKLEDVKAKAPQSKVGSWDPKCVKDWHHAEDMAKALLGGKKQIGIEGSRQVVKVEDVAVGLMICLFCTKNMNRDGTLPTARVRAFWNAMHEAGETTRRFSGVKWKAVRNLLSQYGAIQWVSNLYEIGGRAMKWCLTPAVVDMLDKAVERAEQGETGKGQEKKNLYVNTLDEGWLKVLSWTPEGSYTVPEMLMRTMSRLEELRELEERLEILLANAA